MRLRIRHVVFVCLCAGILGAEPVSFQRQVQPVLEKRCAPCHQGKTPAGGVLLSGAGWVGSSQALVAGDPAKSLLLAVISGEKPRMPKTGPPLKADEIALLEVWIREGAKDDTPGSEQSGLWSLKPIHETRPPADGNPIDAFIQAKLRETGLTSSPAADRRTLIRRLTYDLHGLPPTWDEVRAFVSDKSPDAYEKLVDRLLASPRYGERWGRHWLDVVHYGESHGYDKDKPRRNAWPYRNYVIRSMNEDKPYTRFIEEQLAGDYLFPDDPQATVATGFLAAGPWDFVGHAELREGTTDKEITRLLDRDDMLMTVMSSLTSMTAHCARCHNHKFDPIPQEDYYKLQAVFAGIDRADRPYDKNPQVYHERRKLIAERRGIMAKLQPLLDKAAAVTTPEIEELDRAIRETRKHAELKNQLAEMTEKRKQLVRAQLDEGTVKATDSLTAEAAITDAEIAKLPKPEMVYAASNFFDIQGTFRWPIEPRPIHLLARGSVESPGKLVEPGALSCVKDVPFEMGADQSEGARRAALARWITHERNPLTWRSIVNRVWHYHFGAGLVDSPNDFGHMGFQPSNPALLDWLAADFRANGGSLKRLHRMIVTSATYRQSSQSNAANAKIDADNRYLWRMNRQRLDAESVRDSALAASGKLDLTMGGPSAEQFFFKDDHSPVYDYSRFDVDSPASYRRSVYRMIIRSVPDPLMERLDCPDSSLMTAKRNTTITAIQALALMNNPLIVRQAEHMSERIRSLSADAREQLSWAYRLALSREPAAAETDRLVKYAGEFGLESACRLILNSNEFLFVD